MARVKAGSVVIPAKIVEQNADLEPISYSNNALTTLSTLYRVVRTGLH